jgi:GT2 family glycosyltransferase
MVPRESFSRWPDALEHLARTVPAGTRLVAVDAGAPAPIAERLRDLAAAHDVLLLRVDEHLAPNEARALALAHVDTEHVVFIDNDAFGEPGWLERLEACAAETGAWAVGPLYGIGHPLEGRVHMAGGRNRIVAHDGHVELDEAHLHANDELVATLGRLERAPTELVEFHCVLLRRSALDQVPIDTGLLSILEHNALCLGITAAGGSIWLEPDAQVTYWPVTRPTPEDLDYFLTRWSRRWNQASARRFGERFGLPGSDALRTGQLAYGCEHRLRLSPVGRRLQRLPRVLREPLTRIATRLERTVPAGHRSPWDGEPTVVHRPAWAHAEPTPA